MFKYSISSGIDFIRLLARQGFDPNNTPAQIWDYDECTFVLIDIGEGHLFANLTNSTAILHFSEDDDFSNQALMFERHEKFQMAVKLIGLLRLHFNGTYDKL